jgi:hypothetical protein
MKLWTGLFILWFGLLNVSTAWSAPDEHARLANEFLSLMEADTRIDLAVQKAIDAKLKASPHLLPYKRIIIEFFQKHMGWSAIEERMVELCMDRFSVDDLRAYVEFYSSPSGKKLTSGISDVFQEGLKEGMLQVSENSAELKVMIAEEAKRIQKIQENQP